MSEEEANNIYSNLLSDRMRDKEFTMDEFKKELYDAIKEYN